MGSLGLQNGAALKLQQETVFCLPICFYVCCSVCLSVWLDVYSKEFSEAYSKSAGIKMIKRRRSLSLSSLHVCLSLSFFHPLFFAVFLILFLLRSCWSSRLLHFHSQNFCLFSTHHSFPVKNIFDVNLVCQEFPSWFLFFNTTFSLHLLHENKTIFYVDNVWRCRSTL